MHLCDYPEPAPGLRDEQLEWQMQVARDAVKLGHQARAHARLKVRQPLREAVVVAAGRERDAIARFEGLVLDELNVKGVRYVSEADELGRFELKPNYRSLGPALRQAHAAGGRRGGRARRPARGLPPLREGGEVHVAIDGRDHALGPDDVQLVLQPLEGYQVERSGTHAVALNLEVDEELRLEALAREVVHAVQGARKDAGLDVGDRIGLGLGGRRRPGRRRSGARGLREGRDAGRPRSSWSGAADGARVEIEGMELRISIERAREARKPT